MNTPILSPDTPAAPEERRLLRSLSRRTGAALLLVCALQLAAGFAAVRLQGLFGAESGLWLHVLAALGGMTILSGALAGKQMLGGEILLAKTEPCPALEACLLVPAGAALCMAGNAAGAIAEQLAGRAGLEFHGAPEIEAPQGLPLLLLQLLTTALLPALAEEWLLRGVLLPPLRRFGGGFAVACTAALFALLHQNMQQAPMAFVSGLVLGWAYIRSGRLLVPVAIHFWNNAAVSAFMLLSDRAANVYVMALGAFGLLCLLILYANRPAPQKAETGLSAGRQAMLYFFGSVPMVLALVYYIAMIVLNTSAV